MKTKEHYKAIRLRETGHSVKEIAMKVGVAKSTASLWVSDVRLSEDAKQRLLKRIKLGQYVSAERKKTKVKDAENKYLEEARLEVKTNPHSLKIICAMLFWCEGTKNPKSGLTFTNSDPNLVAKFLSLLRQSFVIHESKFRLCIHIHGYHSPSKQLDFWSRVTDIKKEQFIKPYLKPNTGKRIHEGYQGCVSVRYHSTDLARRLIAIAKAFLEV